MPERKGKKPNHSVPYHQQASKIVCDVSSEPKKVQPCFYVMEGSRATLWFEICANPYAAKPYSLV
jgi:hypothetical protein